MSANRRRAYVEPKAPTELPEALRLRRERESHRVFALAEDHIAQRQIEHELLGESPRACFALGVTHALLTRLGVRDHG